MASTRNINQRGNYLAEQMAYKQQADYNTNKEYGVAKETYLAGDGLIQGHLPRQVLSMNPVNVESWLFGISSTNLVTPQKPLSANLACIPSASIMNKVPLIMPHDLNIESAQRSPLFYGNK